MLANGALPDDGGLAASPGDAEPPPEPAGPRWTVPECGGCPVCALFVDLQAQKELNTVRIKTAIMSFLGLLGICFFGRVTGNGWRAD